VGAGWAAFGGARKLAKVKVVGLNLGGQQMKVGPMENIQFMYVLIDRALIFYSHIINWAHGRRDYPVPAKRDQSPGALDGTKPKKAGFTASWGEKERQTCARFFQAVRTGDEIGKINGRKALRDMLKKEFKEISHSERKYGLVLRQEEQ
jgi:hypothetical protein